MRRNGIPKHVTVGKTERTRTGGRRCKQLLDDLKEKKKYWNLTKEADLRALWRTRFGKGYGHFARETAH